VNRRGGLQIYCFTDLTYRRRKTSVENFIFHVIQYFLLFFADSAICHMYLPPWVKVYLLPDMI